MSIEAIKELIGEFKNCDLSKLQVKCQDFELLLEREKEQTIANGPVRSVYEHCESIAIESNREKPVSKEPVEEQAYIESPMVGTFYAASAPGKPPYVTVGSKVKKGDVVCIIEAMKLMNEVEAEVDGEIVEILVKNEEIVEYGQPLFKIK